MSFEKEQALLGGLMKLNSKESDIACYVLDTMKASMFYSSVHKEIYKAIHKLYKQDRLFDNLSVLQSLSENNIVNLIDVDMCYQYHAEPQLMRDYANSVKESAQERFAIAKMADVTDIISNAENGDIQQRLGLCESVISGLIEQMQNREKKGLISAGEMAGKWIDDKEAYSKGTIKPYELGIKSIDEAFKPKGVTPGSLVVVGARPKMGKTFTAVKVMDHFLKTTDKAVCAFSMEMRNTEIWERSMSIRGKVDSDSFYNVPWENNVFWDMAGKINVDLANSKYYIDDGTNLTVSHIKNEARAVHRKNEVGLIMVDYLTLMKGEEAERNDLKYGEITKQLKSLAKELGCVVLLLTQLNRSLESRIDKRPFPSDSRDTGQIEQDCDVWIGLYRESVYNEDCGHDLTEAIVRLNRNGKCRTAYMRLCNGYLEDVCDLEANRVLETAKKDKNKQEEKDNESFSNRYKKNKK